MAGWLRAFRDEAIAAPIVVGAAAVVVVERRRGDARRSDRLMAAVFAGSSLFIAVPLAGAHFLRVRRERMRGASD